MKILPSLLFLAACQGCAGPQLYREASPTGQAQAIYRMSMDFDGDGSMDSSCTVWRVQPHVFGTAKHCAVEDALLTVGPAHLVAVPLEVSEDHDVAVLWVPGDTGRASLALADSEPRFGERLHYIGYPWYGSAFHHGYYEGNRGDVQDDGLVEFSGWVDGGASGSPIMSEAGEVVGVVVASYRGGPYSFYEPVQYLKDLLD